MRVEERTPMFVPATSMLVPVTIMFLPATTITSLEQKKQLSGRL